MDSYLPQSDGYLPYWLLFVSIVAFGNTIQTYLTLDFTSQVYLSGPSASTTSPPPKPSSIQVTPLQSRLFGLWSLGNALVRFYAAYNIHNSAFYQLAFLTYVVALAHFGSEWFVFGTARWGRGLAGPIFVAGGSCVWMVGQWGFYTG